MKTRPEICIIAAVAADMAIGVRGDMPFHISADLKRFKSITMGCPLIMGRRTFESLPKGALPGRRNIVVTRNESWSAPDAEKAPSIDEALKMCCGNERVMVIGGGDVYRQMMPEADRLYLTHIMARVPDADTYFPAPDANCWVEESRSDVAVDPRSGAEYYFADYVRR